jgi:hypothetical protein
METTFDPRESAEPGIVEAAKANPASGQNKSEAFREVALRP